MALLSPTFGGSSALAADCVSSLGTSIDSEGWRLKCQTWGCLGAVEQDGGHTRRESLEGGSDGAVFPFRIQSLSIAVFRKKSGTLCPRPRMWVLYLDPPSFKKLLCVSAQVFAFLICKMGLRDTPPSRDCCESEMILLMFPDHRSLITVGTAQQN